MKRNRWLWLAVLPWAVVQTTWTWEHADCKRKTTPMFEVKYNGMFTDKTCCLEAKEACQDFVEAMNAAHERRYHQRWVVVPTTMTFERGDIGRTIKCYSHGMTYNCEDINSNDPGAGLVPE